MKKHPAVVLILLVSILADSCLKGHLPAEVVLPGSHIDSTFLNYFQQTNGVIAGEGARSLTLSDGRTLWLFGNAHINDYISATGLMVCTTNVHSAAMVSDANFSMTTINNGATDFIPSNETGKWFKPLHAYQYADTIFVFAKKMGVVQNTKTYVAKFHFPDFQYLKIDSFSYNNTNYGYTVSIDKALGFGYIYGLYQPNEDLDNPMRLARFPMNSLHSKWQFYSITQDQWVDVASSASDLVQIPGENFSIRKVRDKIILLTQQKGKSCNHGTELYTQTAANFWGTFLNHQLIYTIADTLNGVTPVTYGATLHPQFLNSNDEMLITYAINGYGSCIPTCLAGFDHPDYYRIRTLRVGLKKIDAAF